MCSVGLTGVIAVLFHAVGFVRLRLADRVYGFHSAGEIYILSGMYTYIASFTTVAEGGR